MPITSARTATNPPIKIAKYRASSLMPHTYYVKRSACKIRLAGVAIETIFIEPTFERQLSPCSRRLHGVRANSRPMAGSPIARARKEAAFLASGSSPELKPGQRREFRGEPLCLDPDRARALENGVTLDEIAPRVHYAAGLALESVIVSIERGLLHGKELAVAFSILASAASKLKRSDDVGDPDAVAAEIERLQRALATKRG